MIVTLETIRAHRFTGHLIVDEVEQPLLDAARQAEEDREDAKMRQMV